MSDISLSGVQVSSLSSIEHLLDDLKFLLSEPISNITNQYQSKTTSYKAIYDAILQSVATKLGDMSREISSDYALISHKHPQYNAIQVRPLYNNSGDTIKLADVTINGNSIGLYAPIQTKTRMPELGQLKFVHHMSPIDIDITSGSFDGWVYADGKQYNAFEFPGISVAFDVIDGKFNVPNLDGFVEMCPMPTDISYDEKISSVIPPHHHTIDINLSGEVDGVFEYSSADCGEGSGSHGADKADTTWPYKIDIDCKSLRITSTNSIQPSIQVGGETHPSYVSLPVMIYIGLHRPENVNQEDK